MNAPWFRFSEQQAMQLHRANAKLSRQYPKAVPACDSCKLCTSLPDSDAGACFYFSTSKRKSMADTRLGSQNRCSMCEPGSKSPHTNPVQITKDTSS